MKTRLNGPFIAVISLIFPAFSLAQVPVDEQGRSYEASAVGASVVSVGEDGIPLLGSLELQELVGPVALYPDDLLAIVLPASAYPLQIAAAARFLEARESDPSLQPDPDWDDSVIALLNYPEVIDLLNEDLDWTYRLGEAVVAQQADVIAAVEAFRDRAYTAGNLKTDEYQTVARSGDTIHITPVAEDVIYVPYYEPARVVVYQPRPVYYYYPRAYPVYYYPYHSSYAFRHGYFWGVTTAFSIGWWSDSLHVWHHSYRGHPYYGRRYWDNWWYRRPSISHYNTTYVTYINGNRHRHGDRWRPRQNRREYVVDQGYARDRNRDRYERRSPNTQPRRVERQDPIRFRDRPDTFVRTEPGKRAPQSVRRDQVPPTRDRRTQFVDERPAVTTRRTVPSGRDVTPERRQSPPTRQVAPERRPAPTYQRPTDTERRATPPTRRVAPAERRPSLQVQRPQESERRVAPPPRELHQPARESRQQEYRQPPRQSESRSERPARQESRSDNRESRSRGRTRER